MLFNKKTYHFYFISIVLFYCLHYFGWKCQQLLSALMFTSSKSVTLRWFQKPLVTSAVLHFHISHPLPEFYGSLFPSQDIFLKVIATSHNLELITWNSRNVCIARTKVNFFLYNNLLISWQKWNAYWKRATGFHQITLEPLLYAWDGFELLYY